MRLLLLLLEELLEELHLVVGGQRRARAQARGLRGRGGKEHPGRSCQHGLLGVGRGLEERRRPGVSLGMGLLWTTYRLQYTQYVSCEAGVKWPTYNQELEMLRLQWKCGQDPSTTPRGDDLTACAGTTVRKPCLYS